MSKKNKQKGSKKSLFKLIYFTLLLSILPLVEGILVLTGTGFDPALFSSIGKTGFRVQNPEVPNKYFPNQKRLDNRSLDFQTSVFRPGSDSTYKVVLLGDSAAQGFPYPGNQGFAGMLERAWNRSYTKPIEVINLALSAQTSFTVADMVSKLGELKPDVLMIYSGNNEYYGTYAVSSGGSFEQRKLALWLREFRLFQTVFDALAPESQNDVTLMAQQFNKTRFAFRDGLEESINRSFLRNMEEVLAWASQKGVPCVFIAPPHNLIDMPPFAGAHESEFIPEILQLSSFLQERKLPEFEKLYSETIKKPEAEKNAHLAFLHGRYLFQTGDEAAEVEFVRSKDLDLNPFRPKSSFYKDYQAWAQDRLKAGKNLVYLDLRDSMRNSKGLEAFSAEFFLDHVHFNWEGNVFVAHALQATLVGLLKPPVRPEPVTGGEQHYVSIIGESAAQKINNLFKAPPFSTMVLKVDPLLFTVHPKSEKFASVVEGGNLPNTEVGSMFSQTYRKAMESRNLQVAYDVLTAYLESFPAHPEGLLNSGKLWSMTNKPQRGVIYFAAALAASEGTASAESAVKSTVSSLPVELRAAVTQSRLSLERGQTPWPGAEPLTFGP